MFTFLHAADIHLDSPLVGLEGKTDAPLDALRGATREALENLVQLALDEEVSFVLLAGDIYDGDWKDYNTGLFFVRQMARLERAGIPVFLVSGNHDAASTIARRLRLPGNVHAFSTRRPETRVLEDPRVAIHGQGFATRAVTEDLVAGYPPAEPGLVNIGLLHTSLTGRPGHEPYAPCTVEALANKGYHYWALGHVHTREVVCEDPWIVFPGNPQGRHARETGEKGCVLVTADEAGVTEVLFRPLDVLRWTRCEVDAAGVVDPDQVVDRVRAALERALSEAGGRLVAARVVVTGACPAHPNLQRHHHHWVQQVRAAAADVGADGLWIEKVSFDTRPAADPAAALSRDDALGGLLQRLQATDADPARLAAYAQEFSALRNKLPAQYFAAGGLDPTDPEALARLLGPVRDLLVARLLEGAGEGGR